MILDEGMTYSRGRMTIYTGNCEGAKLEKAKSFGLGIMIASSPTWRPSKAYSCVPCALDNGAFQCWRRGFPFMADVFRETLAKAYEVGLSLDFIVCPDIVAAGKQSLEFSMKWAKGELQTVSHLALVVQDGMEPSGLMKGYHLPYFSHIFVGGTLEWKWRTAKEWIKYAHECGLKAHIGRCGTLQHLKAAEKWGADSVDSTSFARNDSWHIIERFRGSRQENILLNEDKSKDDQPIF